MNVSFHHFQRSVTENLLECVNVAAVLQEVCGECVPQQMGADARNICLCFQAAEHQTQGVVGDGGQITLDEYRRVFHRQGTVREIPQQKFAGLVLLDNFSLFTVPLAV